MSSGVAVFKIVTVYPNKGPSVPEIGPSIVANWSHGEIGMDEQEEIEILRSGVVGMMADQPYTPL